MKKGIIMEVNDSYLTLLTPEGEFLLAHKQDIPYTIGEEIHFFPIANPNSRKNYLGFFNIFRLKTVWMSMVVLLICLGSIIPIYQSNKTYAYMSIDVGTSIEFGLNKKLEVVDITGYSDETEKIIGELNNWERKKLAELTPIIIERLEDKGLIKQNKPVILSTIKTKAVTAKVEDKLKEHIEAIKRSVTDQKVEVNTYTTTEDEVDMARELGVPIGKYQKEKNKSVEKGSNKENSNTDSSNKSTSKDNVSTPSTPTTKFPPGQAKKQEENNGSNMEQPMTNGIFDENIRQDVQENNPKSNGQRKNSEQSNSQLNNGQIKKSEKDKQEDNN